MSALKAGGIAAARDARRTLQSARTRTQRRADRFVDVYVAGFALLLLSAWLLSFVHEASLAATSVGDPNNRGSAGVLATSYAFILTGAMALALGAVGPVSASRAEAQWLLSTSADRPTLLRRPLAATLTCSALGGALAGLVVGVAAMGGDPRWLPLLAGASVGALYGAFATITLLAAQSQQSLESIRAYRPVGRLLGSAAMAVGFALLVALEILSGQPAEVLSGLLDPRRQWAFLALTVVVAGGAIALFGARAPRLLANLTDAGLAAGREVLEAAIDSTNSMDARVAEGLAQRRHTARRGRFSSRAGRARGAFALLEADMAATWRRRQRLVLHLIWIPIAIGVAQGLGNQAALVTGGLATTWASRGGGVGLRTWLGSPGLRRFVAAPHTAVTAALSVAPLLMGTAISLPLVLILHEPTWTAAYLSLIATAATIRSEDVITLELGPMVSTPMGALPLGLIRSVLHGPDLALVFLMLVVAWPHPWVLVPACVAMVWQVSRSRPQSH